MVRLAAAGPCANCAELGCNPMPGQAAGASAGWAVPAVVTPVDVIQLLKHGTLQVACLSYQLGLQATLDVLRD